MKEQDLRHIIRKEIRSALNEKVSASLTTKMDRVDKIETLVSMEKEIMGYRKELCQELLNMSKGKW